LARRFDRIETHAFIDIVTSNSMFVEACGGMHGLPPDTVQLFIGQGIEISKRRRASFDHASVDAESSRWSGTPAPPETAPTKIVPIVFTSAAIWEGKTIPSLRWAVPQDKADTHKAIQENGAYNIHVTI
jgi:hypothetical protein